MKFQIIAFIILILQFGIITWDGLKNRHSFSKRWNGISRVAFAAIGPLDLIAVIYGHSMLGYSGKIPGIILSIIGLVFIYIFLIDRNRKEGPKRILNRISRNPMYMGLIFVYVGILLMFCTWLLILWTVFTLVIIRIQVYREEKKMMEIAREAYKQYKKRVFRFLGIKNWIYIAIVVFLCIDAIFLYNKISAIQVQKLATMNFDEQLEYTTRGNGDAVISVGIVKNGKAKYTVYGKNGEEIDHVNHTYEVGSITKSLTASLVNKAIAEGKMNLNDEINVYLDLPEDNFYPTIQELLTHTSGYKTFYLESEMIISGLIDRNIFYGIEKDKIIKHAANASLPMETYDYRYSNYGYALLGVILEKVYETEYETLLKEYAESLGMKNTIVSQSSGDLGNYAVWDTQDAYISSSGVQSTINDMLKYANLNLTDSGFAKMHESLRVIGDNTPENKAYGIHLDEIGMTWIIDNTNHFVWTSGATDNYNMYIGLSMDKQIAVVIMSNLPSDYRASATMMGVNLLKAECKKAK